MTLSSFLLYLLGLILLTLGTVTVCGLAVHLCARLFSRLMGGASDAVFDVTSVIGTPIHELGHAAMCLLFGHRIERIKLWTLHPQNGVYGYVDHRYSRKNLWARLGNLPIALGPIFSGLGVTVLVLLLCFPHHWKAYLEVSREVAAVGTPLKTLWEGICSLFAGLPRAILQNPIQGILGLLVILPVSLHISLSWQDIRSALGALPIYLPLLALFALITQALKLHRFITASLVLFNLRLLSLFCLVVAFAAVWVLIALLIRAIRALIRCF